VAVPPEGHPSQSTAPTPTFCEGNGGWEEMKVSFFMRLGSSLLYSSGVLTDNPEPTTG